jgi:hypothetical protein
MSSQLAMPPSFSASAGSIPLHLQKLMLRSPTIAVPREALQNPRITAHLWGVAVR